MAKYIFSDVILDPDLVGSFDPGIDSLVFTDTPAAAIHLSKSIGGITLTTFQGSVFLPMTIDQIASGTSLELPLQSRLVTGDNSVDKTNDDLANSYMEASPGDDQFHGLGGDDYIQAGQGDDLIYGNQGDDSLLGSGGADSLYGGQGADRISDTVGDNLVYGNLGADTVQTGLGNDTIYGGQDDDWIRGGSGSDLIFGNRGTDILTGGAGADGFVYRRPADGLDLITDFTKGEDKIILAYRVLQIGAVTTDNFVSSVDGPQSASAQTRFIYDQDQDILWFDPDGTGSIAPQAMIKFQVGSQMALADNLEAGDFQVMGIPKNLTGTESADTLTGQSGTDHLCGLGGNDLLEGGVGADTLNGGSGADTLDGGQGNDVARYDDHGTGIAINLLHGVAVDGNGATDTLIGIEQVVGTAFNDVMKGDPRIFYTLFNGKVPYAGGLKLFGMGGNDSLVGANGWYLDGGDGMDTLVAAGGNNYLVGGAANDSLVASSGNDTLAGGSGNDYGFGGDGDDAISGNAGTDWLAGGDGNDLLLGDGVGTTRDYDDDTLVGGLGDDTLNGGDGLFDPWGGDVASYQDAQTGLRITIDAGTVTTSRGETDVLVGIEGVAGTDFADTVTANDGVWVDAGDGNDVINGQAGNDRLKGGDGDDRINGLAGDDLIHGGDGNDLIDDGLGLDTVFAGAGEDTVTTGGSDSFASVSGGDGDDQITGGVGSDFFHGDTGNDVLFGAAGNDTLFADSGLDTLWGQDGNDALSGQEHPLAPGGAVNRLTVNSNEMFGGSGDDLLVVGYTSNNTGVDTLSGGTGADDFLFQLAQDLVDPSLFNNLGLITDFETGVDRILIEVDTGLTMETALVDGVNFVSIAEIFDGTNGGVNPTYVFSEANSTLYYAPGAPEDPAPLALLTLEDNGTLSAGDIWLTP